MNQIQAEYNMFRYDNNRLDFVEEFLARNLDHCAEAVFSYLTFQVIHPLNSPLEKFPARNLDHCAEAVFSYLTFQVIHPPNSPLEKFPA
jgi:hypothetical protein